MASVPPETRAQVARRRLAELAANFDASLPPAEPEAEPLAEERSAPRPRPGSRRAPRLRSVHVRLVTVLAGAAAILLVWWLVAGRPHEVAVPASTAALAGGDPASSETAAAPSGEVVVDVAGRVRRPGIVTLPAGSRVHEAIDAAGGLKGRVDTAGLNLARVLTDGEQILVGAAPAATAASPATGAAAPGAAPGVLINLNTADAAALDTLPGVGPVTAQAILTWREENGPFRSVDDLLDVKGIGEATLAELRDLVSV